MRYVACPTCGRLCSPGPRCPTCSKTKQRIYDLSRPSHHSLYGTNAWRSLSKAVRQNATRCHWCGKQTRRLVADHVIPVEERPDLALEPTNLRPSCYGCNTRRGRNLAPVRWQQ